MISGRVVTRTKRSQTRPSEPTPLFDSEDDFAAACRRLIDQKKLNGSAP